MTKKEQNAILAEMERQLAEQKNLLESARGHVFSLECKISGMEHSMIAFTKTSDKLLQIKANEKAEGDEQE